MGHTPHLATHPHPLLQEAVPRSDQLCPRPRFSCLTSSAGVAQGAADFILVQVGVWDHQDVGTPAQGAVIRSLAPHFLIGQRTVGHGRAG